MPYKLPVSFYFILCIMLIAANISVYRTIFAPPTLTMKVLEVAKGKPVLLQTPSGETILVDTGADASILRALGAALPFWQRRLDGVIITSKTARSAGGLPDVESRYKIGTLVRSAYRGDRFIFGGGVYADVLWPPQTPAPMNTANSALVLRLSYGSTTILIQPDLSPRIARFLSSIDTNLPPSDLVISSSTPPGTFISNGTSIVAD